MIFFIVFTVGNVTEVFYGNIKMLLFGDEEYKGAIFKNYNIDKNLRLYVKKLD
jgi:hypothetical protein